MKLQYFGHLMRRADSFEKTPMLGKIDPWDSPAKNIEVCCHTLLHGIFPTQGLNPGVLHCRQILYCLSHQGSPKFIKRRYDYSPSKRGTLKSEFSLRATYLFMKLNTSRKTSDKKGPHERRSLCHRVWHSVGTPLVFLAYGKPFSL